MPSFASRNWKPSICLQLSLSLSPRDQNFDFKLSRRHRFLETVTTILIIFVNAFQMSPPVVVSTGLAITNPLIAYRALLATKRIDPDPAQVCVVVLCLFHSVSVRIVFV